jgi:hypothetical protein
MFAANMASVTVNTTSAFGVVAAFLGPLVGVVVGAWGAWSVARAGDKTAQKGIDSCARRLHRGGFVGLGRAW